jgi:hypothetical protein
MSSTVANSADAFVNTMSVDQRFATLTSIGDCVDQDELRMLLEKRVPQSAMSGAIPPPRCI